MKRFVALLAPFMLLLAFAAPAGADEVRWASPLAGDLAPCDQPATGCSLKAALTKPRTTPGVPVTVNVKPGVYGSPWAPLTDLATPEPSSGHVLQAADPAHRPLIHASAPAGYAISLVYGTVRNIDVSFPENPPPETQTYTGVAAWRIENVTAAGTLAAAACALTPSPAGSRVANSVCATSSGEWGAAGLSIGIGGSVTFDTQIANVTAWASEANGIGVQIGANGTATVNADISNSIIHGGLHDVSARNLSVPPDVAYANAVIDHSNFSSAHSTADVGSSITSDAVNGNQSAAPLLTNPALYDFTQLEGSPTIDAGDDAAVVGLTDVVGAARIQGSHVDIGAHESAFTTPEPGPAPEPTPPAATVLTQLKAKSARFRSAKSGKSFRPASKQPKVKKKKKKGQKRKPSPTGTQLSFRLSAADQVSFTLERAYKGRKSGKTCKKQTKKTARKKRCTYFKRVKGVERITASAGTNKLWWTGRWRGKKLSTKATGWRLLAQAAGSSTSVRMSPKTVRVVAR